MQTPATTHPSRPAIAAETSLQLISAAPEHALEHNSFNAPRVLLVLQHAQGYL